MPTITVHMPDDFVIPDGYEHVADFRKAESGDMIVHNYYGLSCQSAPSCTIDHYIVLRKKWQAPECLRGKGYWYGEHFSYDGYVFDAEPKWDGRAFDPSGDRDFVNIAFFAALGFTKPDLSHLKPEERKIQL